MSNFFARRGAAYVNEMTRSLGALVGMAQGMLADRELNDPEIKTLAQWLQANDAIAAEWPGDVIHTRIKTILADGIITEAERAHLVLTLQQLIGGTLDDLAASTHVTELALDQIETMPFPESLFCLTGDFVFGPRESCIAAIERRGGFVKSSVTKKLHYLVIGGLGSSEWKHGSFGTKIETAIRYKREGLPIKIVHEDQWAALM